jgi:L-lactate utilization protein LutC
MTENEAFEAEEYAEYLLALYKQPRSKQMSDEELLIRLNQAVGDIIRSCIWSFSTAAQKWMKQAAELMSSPKYNRVLRKRYEREAQVHKEQREKWKAETEARRKGAVFKDIGKTVQ